MIDEGRYIVQVVDVLDATAKSGRAYQKLVFSNKDVPSVYFTEFGNSVFCRIREEELNGAIPLDQYSHDWLKGRWLEVRCRWREVKMFDSMQPIKYAMQTTFLRMVSEEEARMECTTSSAALNGA